MGLHFGELAKIRGIVMYKLSPYEQRAFAGAIKYGIPNVFRRFRECIFVISPPFIVGYLVYQWAEFTHHQAQRKNPRDYMYEVDPDVKEEE